MDRGHRCSPRGCMLRDRLSQSNLARRLIISIKAMSSKEKASAHHVTAFRCPMNGRGRLLLCLPASHRSCQQALQVMFSECRGCSYNPQATYLSARDKASSIDLRIGFICREAGCNSSSCVCRAPINSPRRTAKRRSRRSFVQSLPPGQLDPNELHTTLLRMYNYWFVWFLAFLGA